MALDRDALSAALRSPTGASAAILQAAHHHQGRLLVSVAWVLEYQAKCTITVIFNLRDDGQAPHRFGIELLQPSRAIQRIRT